MCFACCLQTDFLTFEGLKLDRTLTTAFFATHVQLSGVYSVCTSALTPLLVETNVTGLDLQQALIRQMWWQDDNINSTGFSNATIIEKVLQATYEQLVDTYNASAPFSNKLQQYFAAVAEVSYWWEWSVWACVGASTHMYPQLMGVIAGC